MVTLVTTCSCCKACKRHVSLISHCMKTTAVKGRTVVEFGKSLNNAIVLVVEGWLQIATRGKLLPWEAVQEYNAKL